MKRFIDIGSDQTGNSNDGKKEFAFYCTSMDRFESFSDTWTWKTKEEFIKCHIHEGNELDRYLKLIPSDWNK